ncbi:hypothetical protein DYB31_016037, partial [Aphanomyces astaci]
MEQQQMIQQLLEAQTQAQAQVLTNQQAQQENQLKTQQDVQEALLRCVSSNGDQGRSQPRDTERHVEGLSMPAYHEHLNESIVHHRVKTFFAAKNLKYETDEAVEARLSNDDVERISFGVVKEVNDDKGTVGTVVPVEPNVGKKSSALMIKSGVMNGKDVKVLLDSGATHSLCRVGLGTNVIRNKSVRIAAYDNVWSPITNTREVMETIKVDKFSFKDTVMTEWDLKDKDFDVIL